MAERLRRGWELIFGPDPGRERLRFALRVLVAAAATLAILLLLGRVVAMPTAATGVGFIVSAFLSISLRGGSTRSQLVTMALIPPVALAAAAAGTMLAQWHHWAAEAGFVAIVLAASLARLAGSRGIALGMAAFFAYFINIIVRPPATALPMEALALGIALCSVAAVRFGLLRDDPDATLRHVLLDIRWRVAGLVAEVATTLRDRTADPRDDVRAAAGGVDVGETPAACRGEGSDALSRADRQDPAQGHRLHRDMARLADAVLVAEDQIESLGGSELRPAAQASVLAQRIYDLELAAERIVRAATIPAVSDPDKSACPVAGRRVPGAGRTGEERDALLGRLARLHAHLAGGADAGAAPKLEPGSGPGNGCAGFAPMARAITALEQATAALPAGPDGPAAARDAVPGQAEAPASPPEEPPPLWQRPALRQAVQATVAAGCAVWLDSMVSSQRWYWAALAAFIVGIGVRSRSEAMTKGLQRVAGTIIGVLAGILLATALSGQTYLALGCVLVCAFFAYYAWQVAYGVMIFWITLMLAVLYGLLGSFSPHLLWLRLEETAIGSAVAMAVTMLVLPVRTRAVFRADARSFLGALDATLDAATRRLDGGGADSPPRTAARILDRRAQTLRQAVGALNRGWIILVPSQLLQAARLAMECTYLAREIAQAVDAPGGRAEHAPGASFARRSAALRLRIGSLKQALAAPGKPPDQVQRPAPLRRQPGSSPEQWADRDPMPVPDGEAAAAAGDPTALLAALEVVFERFGALVAPSAMPAPGGADSRHPP